MRVEPYHGRTVHFKVTIASYQHLFNMQCFKLMYVDILNGLIFDAVYGSWIFSLLLFTLGNTNQLISFVQ